MKPDKPISSASAACAAEASSQASGEERRPAVVEASGAVSSCPDITPEKKEWLRKFLWHWRNSACSPEEALQIINFIYRNDVLCVPHTPVYLALTPQDVVNLLESS
jgi:hypothetical protein